MRCGVRVVDRPGDVVEVGSDQYEVRDVDRVRDELRHRRWNYATFGSVDVGVGVVEVPQASSARFDFVQVLLNRGTKRRGRRLLVHRAGDRFAVVAQLMGAGDNSYCIAVEPPRKRQTGDGDEHAHVLRKSDHGRSSRVVVLLACALQVHHADDQPLHEDRYRHLRRCTFTQGFKRGVLRHERHVVGGAEDRSTAVDPVTVDLLNRARVVQTLGRIGSDPVEGKIVRRRRLDARQRGAKRRRMAIRERADCAKAAGDVG